MGWTLAIGVACLITLSGLPKVKVENADKAVHFAMHFGFALLWLLYLRTKNEAKATVLILNVLLASLAYGTAIELAQQMLTTTRMADVYDVLANSLGAVAGSLGWYFYDKFR